jgi:hypothetical protein
MIRTDRRHASPVGDVARDGGVWAFGGEKRNYGGRGASKQKYDFDVE